MGCSLEWAREESEKKRKRDFREARKLFREQDRSWWLDQARTAFNQFIRLRDRNLPCISCGRHHTGQYHAGHYRAAGNYSGLRFDERNVHKQCKPCNADLSGNLVDYRTGLLERVGSEVVDWLERKDHPPRRWEIEELKTIRKWYKRKIKRAQRD